jgi:plastocyanin domain-containing protein
MLAITGKPDGYMAFKFRVIAALPFNQDFEIEFSDEELTENA